MELYYKDLISEETSLERLVDNLARIVQGADEFVEVAGDQLPEERRAALRTRLEHIRNAYERVRRQTVLGAQATDRAVRRHPYVATGLAFTSGVLTGMLLGRRR